MTVVTCFFAADLVARLACLPAGFLARLEDVSAGRFFARRSVDFLGVGSAICEGMKILSVTKVNRIILGRSLTRRLQAVAELSEQARNCLVTDADPVLHEHLGGQFVRAFA